MTNGGGGENAAARPQFRCKVLKLPGSLVDPHKRSPIHPPIDVVAGVIREGERFLITQRMPDDTLGGYWEFPGGKVEPGEELPAALRRELSEELGIETEIGPMIHTFVHAYPDRDIRLHFYSVRIIAGEPQRLEVADLTWVKAEQFGEYHFPEADRPLLNQLQGL